MCNVVVEKVACSVYSIIFEKKWPVVGIISSKCNAFRKRDSELKEKDFTVNNAYKRKYNIFVFLCLKKIYKYIFSNQLPALNNKGF